MLCSSAIDCNILQAIIFFKLSERVLGIDKNSSINHTLFISNYTIHYGDVIMGAIASQITSLTIVYSTVYSDADQRKHESSASVAFVRGTHRGPVNSPQKWQVTRKMFSFDDVIMKRTMDTRKITTKNRKNDLRWRHWGWWVKHLSNRWIRKCL